MEIPIFVTAYHWIANENSHPQNPRVAAGGRENRQSESVTAYNRNPNMRYCVEWKSLYALLRTVEISISVTAYNGNPYMRYCVQRKSLYPLLRTIGLLMKIHIPKIPGSPPAAAKIANQNPLLRRMGKQQN